MGAGAHGGGGVSRLSLTWMGRAVEAELELRPPRAVMTREGRRVEAVLHRSGRWIEIEQGGRGTRCAAVVSPRGVWVAIEGRTYVLERAHREAADLEGDRSADEVRAPMTGRVAAVAVKPGAKAREGELLLTIEAMKMEFKLSAPEDGVVTEILCAEGDRVELGQLLVKLEPKESS